MPRGKKEGFDRIQLVGSEVRDSSFLCTRSEVRVWNIFGLTEIALFRGF